MFIYLAWCLVWTLLQTLALHRFQIEWSTAFLDALVSNGILALASLATVQLFRYYQPGVGSGIYRFALVLGITALTGAFTEWSLKYLFVAQTRYLQIIDLSMPIRYVFVLMVLTFVTVLNWLWNSVAEKSKQSMQQSEVEQLHKEAELIKLRQQLQPHFLFNSLNSISALAGSNPAQARKMIQQLSDFLRGTLKKDEDQSLSLEEELKHLALYLDIEKIRFGERLTVVLDCDEASKDKKIPPLLLQPIVENAIKFGLYGTIDDVKISLRASVQQNNLVIEVVNPFDADAAQAGSGTGFGLRFIQRRLFLLYAQNNLLRTSQKDHLFTTQIIIPQ